MMNGVPPGYYCSDDENEDYIDDFDGFDLVSDTSIPKCRSTPKQYNVNPEVVLENELTDAAMGGNLKLIQEIFANSDLNSNTVLRKGWTALMFAASESQDHIVKYLLSLPSTNPNKSCASITPLMCACLSDSFQNISNYACVKYLLDKKAIVNVGDAYGETPLMRAVARGKSDVVDLLLPLANLEMKDCQGKTAIFFATDMCPDIFKKLITKGADLNVITKSGMTLSKHLLSDDRSVLLRILDKYLCVDDDYESHSCCGEPEKWEEMFPGVLYTEEKAYFKYIKQILYAMNCSSLESSMMENNVDLESFLCFEEEDLIRIGIQYPFERKKILTGLHKFHTYKWKLKSVEGLRSNKEKTFDIVECLSTFASHLLQLTILKTSLQHVLKNVPKETVHNKPTELSSTIRDLVKTGSELRKELQAFRYLISKLNEKQVLPSDLIGPNHPLSMKSMKKTKIIVTIAFTTVVFLISKPYRHFQFNLSFNLGKLFQK